MASRTVNACQLEYHRANALRCRNMGEAVRSQICQSLLPRPDYPVSKYKTWPTGDQNTLVPPNAGQPRSCCCSVLARWRRKIHPGETDLPLIPTTRLQQAAAYIATTIAERIFRILFQPRPRRLFFPSRDRLGRHLFFSANAPIRTGAARKMGVGSRW